MIKYFFFPCAASDIVFNNILFFFMDFLSPYLLLKYKLAIDNSNVNEENQMFNNLLYYQILSLWDMTEASFMAALVRMALFSLEMSNKHILHSVHLSSF